MVLWSLVGAVGALATMVNSQQAGGPTALQMAYARTAVAMRTCEPDSLKELKKNPIVADSMHGHPLCSSCAGMRHREPGLAY